MRELLIVEVDDLSPVVLNELRDLRQANDVLNTRHLWGTLEAPFRNRIFML